jgi:hypothetical protein
MSNIADIHAREVIDSRGNPTVEAESPSRTDLLDEPSFPAELRLVSTKPLSCAMVMPSATR